MAVSDVSICNLALTRLGDTMITSLTDDTRQARLCNLHYERVRSRALMLLRPKCATYRAELTELAGEPEWGYNYHYQLPTSPKCLLVLEVNGETDVSGWVIEDGKLLTDMDEAEIRYIGEVTDPTDLTEDVIEVIALMLAVQLAYALKQTRSVVESLQAELERIAIPRALTTDNRNDYVTEAAETPWHEAGR